MIEIRDLSISFKDKIVLKKINLNLTQGNCYALLGKNGAGKSTLINCMLHLIQPDEGEIFFDNMNIQFEAFKIKQKLGALLEQSLLIEEFTAYQYLIFVGNLYKVNKTTLVNKINSLLEYFFDDQALILKKRLSTFSTGMRKKIALCAAVLHNPSALILDEPFSGLDLPTAEQLIKFLRLYINNPKNLIFLSSHDLLYVNKIATDILVLHEKKIVFNDKIEHFLSEGKNSMESSLEQFIGNPLSEINKIDWL